MLLTFSQWLATTSASAVIRDAEWIIPTVQSIHILAMCMVIGSALVLNLRLLRVIGRDEPVATFTRRYLPWLVTALVVLLVSGSILIIGEPDRTMHNWVFWTKMSLLAAGLFLTALFWIPMSRDRTYWDLASRRTLAASIAAASLAVWSCIIFCGRWIAYVL